MGAKYLSTWNWRSSVDQSLAVQPWPGPCPLPTVPQVGSCRSKASQCRPAVTPCTKMSVIPIWERVGILGGITNHAGLDELEWLVDELLHLRLPRDCLALEARSGEPQRQVLHYRVASFARVRQLCRAGGIITHRKERCPQARLFHLTRSGSTGGRRTPPQG